MDMTSLEASELISAGLCVGEKEGLRVRLTGLGPSTDLAFFLGIGNRCDEDGTCMEQVRIINVRRENR